MCGCNGGALTPEGALAAAGQTFHYVMLDGNYTGRRFTSILAAGEYASSVGGSTQTEAPEGFE